MTTSKATSILKLVGILVIFLGLVLTTILFFQLTAVEGMSEARVSLQVNGAIAKMGFYGYLATASISVWGYLLYRTSPFFGRIIAS